MTFRIDQVVTLQSDAIDGGLVQHRFRVPQSMYDMDAYSWRRLSTHGETYVPARGAAAPRLG